MSEQTDNAMKVVEPNDRAYFDEPGSLDTIPVLRLSSEGYPDLILNSTKDLADNLLWSFLGESKEWWDQSGQTITISIETMPKAEFDALPPWDELA